MKEIEEIEEPHIVDTSKEMLKKEKVNYFQIDVLKAAMIFLVIFDHMVSWGVKSEIGVALWERISIPVFLVIMGFNMGISFQEKGDLSLKKLYSWNYFKSKILRYIVPFLVLYAFSTLIGLILYRFNIVAMYEGHFSRSGHGIIHLFIGFLPFWGPGNWFLPLLFQSILVMPLLYKAFTKKPILALIGCLIVEITLQLIVFFFIGEITYPEEGHYLYLFMTSVLFYLPAIGLGMWFSFGRDLKSKRNIFMWILFPISLVFIIAHQFFNFRFRIDNVLLLRGDYHFLIVPYSAFLFLLAMMILPQKSDNPISRAISLIGKSTYHILLTQILGYGILFALLGTHYIIDVGFMLFNALNLIYAWIIFIPFGILWYKIDQNKNILRRLLYYINLFLVFSILVFATFIAWPVGDWVPIPFVIILIYGSIGLIIIIAIKKPLNTTILALWTSFLIYNFILTILYIEIIPPTEYIIQNASIGIFFIFIAIGTGLYYTFRK
ncbi:MAG: acyltransferase family protein [Candidatus Hodarchaeota archaeon]